MAATERVLTQIPVIERVRCDGEYIYVRLADGRELGIPLAWSERLSSATPAQRANYQVEEFGAAIHWPDVDEDIGLATFLGVSEEPALRGVGLRAHRHEAPRSTSPSPADGSTGVLSA